MDFLTLVGYFIAALAIAYGLYLILRKNVVKDDDTEQVDADSAGGHAESEELGRESIELYSDHDSRIPVVPRHIRDQLVVPSPEDNAAATSRKFASTEDDDESLLAHTAHINPAHSRQLLEDDAEATIAASHSAVHPQHDNDLSSSNFNYNNNPNPSDDLLDDAILNNTPTHQNDAAAEPNEVLVQQGSHLIDSSRPDQEPAEDMFDQALAQLEAATAPQAQAPNTKHHPHSDMAAQQSDQLAQNTAPHIAQVEEWQGESALLEAHIEDQERRDDESALAQAEHIIALYVMPAASRTLAGERTMQLLRKFGLRYGEMSLFHRFLDSDGTGPLMFSVLRYTSEGPLGFDLEALPNEQVEGLAFFLALPSKHAAAGYDMMVSISTLLAREIQGQVYDEYMNELSPQLREHYRHFVLEYRTPD